MKNILNLSLLILLASCSTSQKEEWLHNLQATTWITEKGNPITIHSTGNVEVTTDTGGKFTYYFDEAKSATEAYYTENGKEGYSGIFISNNSELHQAGTKSDSTSGASLSTKKDFIAFYKSLKLIGRKK